MGRGRVADWRRRSDAHHHQSALGAQMGFASGEPPPVSAADARIPPRPGTRRPDGPDDLGNPPHARAIGRARDRTQFDARGNCARRLGVDLRLPRRAVTSSPLKKKVARTPNRLPLNYVALPGGLCLQHFHDLIGRQEGQRKLRQLANDVSEHIYLPISSLHDVDEA